jgi:hypothetical protein
MFARDYDMFLSIVVQAAVENINLEWNTPYNFEEIDPTFQFIRGMIVHTRLTPFIQDEFLYAGFSYFLDSTVQTKQQVLRINDRIAKNQKETITQFLNLFTQ